MTIAQCCEDCHKPLLCIAVAPFELQRKGLDGMQRQQQQHRRAQQVQPDKLHQPASAASWKLHPSHQPHLGLRGLRWHVLLGWPDADHAAVTHQTPPLQSSFIVDVATLTCFRSLECYV